VLWKVSRCKLRAWESITRAGSGFVGIAEGAGKPRDVLIDTYVDTVSASSQQNVLETEMFLQRWHFCSCLHLPRMARDRQLCRCRLPPGDKVALLCDALKRTDLGVLPSNCKSQDRFWLLTFFSVLP